MDQDLPSDEWLMKQVAGGSREHLSSLLHRYASTLLTFIQRMIGNVHRSEELFQDVFLAVWSARRKYEYPRPFRSWLFGIAMNKCRADFRKLAATPMELEDCPQCVAAVAPSPVDAAIASETATLVAQAVARLPAGQRTVVVMRVWNGLSYKEIAETVGRTEATVRTHMFHGLAAIRKYLEPRLK